MKGKVNKETEEKLGMAGQPITEKNKRRSIKQDKIQDNKMKQERQTEYNELPSTLYCINLFFLFFL